MNRTIACLVLLAIHVALFSQLNPISPTRPTPNASGIGQFGEVPVSLFTGLPQIDIPIHTIQAADVIFPVSLSYNAAGFRPDVHPSWVGQNWTLNAGGAITRTVRHLPDEYEAGGSMPLNVTGMGFYYSHSLLNVSNWYLPEANVVEGGLVKDREPDIFSFNFMGFSGKFYLDHNGNWKVQSDQAFQVIFDPVDFKLPFIFQNCNCYASIYRKTFNKFVLVNNKGVRYTFGTDNAIEYSVGMTTKNGPQFSIVPPDNEVPGVANGASIILGDAHTHQIADLPGMDDPRNRDIGIQSGDNAAARSTGRALFTIDSRNVDVLVPKKGMMGTNIQPRNDIALTGNLYNGSFSILRAALEIFGGK